MTDVDIQNSECLSNTQLSKKLLGNLEKEMTEFNNLISQAFIVASNMEGTWTAIKVTHRNYKMRRELLEELRGKEG
jgi:hypothetical protein